MTPTQPQLRQWRDWIKLLQFTAISLLITASFPSYTKKISAAPYPIPINIANPSFESGDASGWTTATDESTQKEVLSDELAAAPDGTSYARIIGRGSIRQVLTAETVTVTAGQTYVATVWARSVNPPSTYPSLSTKPRIELSVGETTFSSETVSVEAPDITAVKKNGSTTTNTMGDDGVNVWFDDGYRMHAAGTFYSQTIAQDPINDPWTKRGFSGDGMASGPIVIPNNGPKALYDTYYLDQGDDGSISRIERMDILGNAPNYELPDSIDEDDAGEIFHTILEHRGDGFPWVIDAHLTHDPDADRLWMAWGGSALWVTEMDIATGNIYGNPADPEFDTHPSHLHKCVAAWEPRDYRTCVGADRAPDGWDGDENGVAYHEGPALYKKGVWWYLCGSYGSMGFSYTLRCCRSSRPDGPFLDKDGIGCTRFDEGKNRFGASMLLGPEGHQAVPGHPHIWEEEDGTEYLGYDFRNYQNGKDEDNPFITNDEMGIRKLHWINGWPVAF